MTGRTARAGKRSVWEKLALVPHTVWVVMFIVAPLLFVAYYAFTDQNGAFSFENITNLTFYGKTFFMSVCYSLIATAVCLLIGYPLAYCMAKSSPRMQTVLLLLLMLPMWVSLLVRTYSLMAIFDNGGIISTFIQSLGGNKLTFIGTDAAVILGMVYDFLPYMVLPIFTSMIKLDGSLTEAAQDLGCNAFRAMLKVTLPLTVPGVISGVTMVFVPSISTFYISQKLGGGLFDLIGDTIERQFQNPSTYHVGAALSLVMMILILISLTIMNKFSDDEGEVIV
ncbi:MAG: ABC transporter permease [Clostridia bacterium]|nr:ABC transporter permease [Clostridia bacterium]